MKIFNKYHFSQFCIDPTIFHIFQFCLYLWAWNSHPSVPRLNNSVKLKSFIEPFWDRNFSNYAPNVGALFRLSAINCVKLFFEIRPETRFSSLFRFLAIYSPMWRKSKSARKNVFPVEFRKTDFCNRFLKAWRLLILRTK